MEKKLKGAEYKAEPVPHPFSLISLTPPHSPLSSSRLQNMGTQNWKQVWVCDGGQGTTFRSLYSPSNMSVYVAGPSGLAAGAFTYWATLQASKWKYGKQMKWVKATPSSSFMGRLASLFLSPILPTEHCNYGWAGSHPAVIQLPLASECPPLSIHCSWNYLKHT